MKVAYKDLYGEIIEVTDYQEALNQAKLFSKFSNVGDERNRYWSHSVLELEKLAISNPKIKNY